MRRAALALLLALVPAGPAAAKSDPLLSGYGGPGDGEQALLGQTLLLGGSSGRPGAPGTAGAGAAPAPPSPDALFAEEDPVATAPAPAPGRRPARGTGDARSPRRPSADRPNVPLAVAGDGERDVRSVAPARASAPAPVSGRDVLVLGALVLVLAVLAGFARRLAVTAARSRRPVRAQLP